MSPIPPPPAAAATRSAISNSTQPFFYETTDFTSDVTNRRDHPGGVIHVKGGPADTSTKHYWINDLIHVESAAASFLQFGFTYYSFTAYSSQAAWKAAYPSAPIFAVYNPPPPPPPIHPTPSRGTPHQGGSSADDLTGFTTPRHSSPQPSDPTTERLLQMFQQLMTHPPPPTVSATITPPPMPEYFADTPEKLTLYLERLTEYKLNPYFDSVNWGDAANEGNSPASRHVRAELLRTLGNSPVIYTFLGQPQYINNGILMLQHLIDKLNPSQPEHLLAAVLELMAAEQGSDEDGTRFMCRLRGLYARLKGLTIDKFFTLLAVAGLSPDDYPGIRARFQAGDTTITNASIYELSDQVEFEDRRREITQGGTDTPPDPTTAARRAGAAAGSENQKGSYPPSKPVKWSLIRDAFRASEYCPICFHRDDVEWHTKHGCPALASAGYVLVKDKEKSTALIAKFNEYKKGPQEQADDADETSTAQSTASSRRVTLHTASAQKASSAKGGNLKTPEDEPSPSQTIVSDTFYPPTLKSPPETGVKPAARKAHYPDNELDEVDSDYDDEIEYWGFDSDRIGSGDADPTNP